MEDIVLEGPGKVRTGQGNYSYYAISAIAPPHGTSG